MDEIDGGNPLTYDLEDFKANIVEEDSETANMELVKNEDGELIFVRRSLTRTEKMNMNKSKKGNKEKDF